MLPPEWVRSIARSSRCAMPARADAEPGLLGPSARLLARPSRRRAQTPRFLDGGRLTGQPAIAFVQLVERRVTVQPRCSQGFRRHAGVARTIRSGLYLGCVLDGRRPERRQPADGAKRNRGSDPSAGWSGASPWRPYSAAGRAIGTGPAVPDGSSRCTERATQTRSARSPKPGRFMSGPSKFELCEKA